jgi:hypothetical protein
MRAQIIWASDAAAPMQEFAAQMAKDELPASVGDGRSLFQIAIDPIGGNHADAGFSFTGAPQRRRQALVRGRGAAAAAGARSVAILAGGRWSLSASLPSCSPESARRTPRAWRSGCWRCRPRTAAARGWRCGRAARAAPPRISIAPSARSARSSSRGSTAARCTSFAASTTRGCTRSPRPPRRPATRGDWPQEGVSPAAAERAVKLIARALAQEGPLTRHQLRERIAAAGIRSEGQALLHLLGLASLRGLVVRGPLREGEHAYALTRDWLGEPPSRPPDRERALAELARRYLRGHGPAGERDLATWSGLPLRDVRAGLRAIAPRLERRHDGLLDLAGRPAPAKLPPPRLLGPFEPVLLGWRSREWIVGAHQGRIVSGGVFRPFALVGGRAAATWRTTPAGALALDPFSPLRAREEKALRADAEDVARHLKPTA